MSLREELEDFYAEYSEVIDSGALERWPELFVEPCLYRIVSKENYDRGLPLSLMLCESLGMLRDRALSSRKLNVYAPRTWRHSSASASCGRSPAYASTTISPRATATASGRGRCEVLGVSAAAALSPGATAAGEPAAA